MIDNLKTPAPNPVKAAKELLAYGFTPDGYEREIQAKRKQRLETFKSMNIKILVDQEQNLINFGETVLGFMRELEAQGYSPEFA